jgi:hypothetical protein
MGGTGARRERNNNKHKRLFIGGPGALQDGQALYYKTGQDGVLLRSGFAVINPDGVSGIKCDCCNQVCAPPPVLPAAATSYCAGGTSRALLVSTGLLLPACMS